MTFTFRQKIDDDDIIASGSVVLTGAGNFKCVLSDGEETIELEFKFDSDENNLTERYVLEPITPHKGILRLVNFHRNISGFAEPFNVGTLSNRRLSLSLVVYSIGGERLLNYTFMAGAI
jgi:hypothetical protein